VSPRSIAALCLLLIWTAPSLASGDPAAGKSRAAACAGCHGADGNSTNPAWPKLAGQNQRYLIKQLLDFKQGTARSNPMMAPMAAALDDQGRADLAAYFAAQRPAPGYARVEDLRLGERVYRGGNPKTGVPPCMGCHGPRGGGNPLAGYPALGGQHAAYLRAQLEAFRSGKRANDPNRSMRGVVQFMTDREIAAVANYLSGLY